MPCPSRSGSPSRQRGSVLVVVVLSLLAVVALGTLTVLTVRGSAASATHDRFKAIALYAAEAGVAVGMDYVRNNRAPAPNHWTALVNPNNTPPSVPAGIPGNGIKPGQPGNLFDTGFEAWYDITILNNAADSGLAAGTDTDAIVLLQVTGHGPNAASARLEVEVGADDTAPPSTAAPLRILGWRRLY